MTTKVTVDAHAGWPVQVEAEDNLPGYEPSRSVVGTVQPGEVREFYVFDTRRLIITELKKGA